MTHDDEQVGEVLSRREALMAMGVGGAALFTSPGSRNPSVVPFRLPSCIVRPRQTEGPYFVDTRLERADIRAEPAGGSPTEGTLLDLGFQVSRINADGCVPLGGALVDVWQCDAMGVYSGVKDINGLFDTSGQEFLRGYQVTDDTGVARFQTIFPGWYQGRTVHIHFKIRTDPSSGQGHDFTSQLYFDDGVADRVLAAAPYAAHDGDRPRNADDGIFRSGGDQLLVDVLDTDPGLAATFDIGLQID